MANEKWSQKPLITEISNTTEFCILDEAIPKNKRINAKTLLDTKANSSTLSSHTSDTDNPHSVTKTQVGLGNVDNTSDINKPISQAVQSALDSKAPKNSPTFSGAASFGSIYSTGAINSEDTIYAEQQITGNRVMADEQMIFGPDAVIKIITGYNGSTPIYREFPATELNSSDLNGTNYLMVYGTGTPEENAAELQAAYNAAKNMPRYLGTPSTAPNMNYYKGQTFKHPYAATYHKFIVDALNTSVLTDSSKFELVPTESEAKSVRTTVIVAPGEYDFGDSAFVVDTWGIDIVSLTGNSDVIIISTEGNPVYNYGINVTANNILIKGINCKTNAFYIADNLDNLICEYCTGGYGSFAFMGTASGTFNNCIGGESSFGAYGTVSGTFNNCVGGNNSFGANGGTASGIFNNCIGGNYSFGTYGTASGTFNNCIGGNYSFGSDYGGTNGTASGTFNYCIGGEVSFGSNGTASGTFNNCIGGESSFGAYGTVSGTFNNCVGGNNSFGYYGGTIETTARLYYTRLTSGTFPTPVAGGRLILCIDGDNNIVTI